MQPGDVLTHDDLYPCPECGRENLYAGPCESCGWDAHAVLASIKPLAVDIGQRVVLSVSVRYQENADDRLGLDPVQWPKFIVGARLRYLGPSDDPPGGLHPGDVVTVVDRNLCGAGIDVECERGGVDVVWWYEVELVNTAPAPGV